MGDEVACVGPLAILTKGGPTVPLDGKPVVRVGDGTSHAVTVHTGDSRILVNGVPAAQSGIHARWTSHPGPRPEPSKTVGPH